MGEPVDAEADAVARAARDRGATPFFLDLSGFPSKRTLSLDVGPTGPAVRFDGAPVPDVAAWYVRRFGFADPLVREDLDLAAWTAIHGQFRAWVQVENQKAMTVASLLLFLAERARVVNPAETFIAHNRKPYQVFLLQKAGLPVPPFLVTNDADEARRFLERHPRVIYKPVAGGRLTREIDRAHLDARAPALASEPILVQALAEGRHVRAYVAGGRLVGAGEILFDPDVRMDYRASSKGAKAIELPEAIARDCERAAAAVGMPFTGLDVILDDAQGKHAFLECNPSPMFVNFERMTGIPVTAALVDLLLE